MEQIDFDLAGEQFVIKGFPDAAKVIKLSGPIAQRLADMLLHRHDLEFADECLDGINAVIGQPTLQQALWRSALVHVMKCFGSSAARSPLPEKRILRGIPAALDVFDYFKKLRDKYIVHDENAYAQALPGAILNDGTKSYKVEKIVCLGTFSETLNQDSYSNLKLLIDHSRKWTVEQFDLLTEKLTQELEAMPYEKLINQGEPIYRAPEFHEISKTRAPLA